MTALERLLLQGEKKIGVFVWHDSQRTHADAYVKGHAQRIRRHGAEVEVRVCTASGLLNGQTHDGLCVIRYHLGAESQPSAVRGPRDVGQA